MKRHKWVDCGDLWFLIPCRKHASVEDAIACIDCGVINGCYEVLMFPGGRSVGVEVAKAPSLCQAKRIACTLAPIYASMEST